MRHLGSSNKNARVIRLGFVALIDAAPLIMAQELGLYEKHGIRVDLRRQIGWATVRDKIIYGELDGAHAPAGMVAAVSLGLGSVATDCLTALVLNLHGNAITVSKNLWQRGIRTSDALKQEIAARRGKTTFTFGVVYPFSSHPYLLREWLRSGGIDPDRDVRVVVVPPAQMVANLKGGHVDGYCVGEPWNSLALMTRTGYPVATSADVASLHPEKVLMVRASFAETQAAEHLALVSAVREACAFCDSPQNRERVAETLAEPEFLNAPIESLRMSLRGTFDFGGGRVEKMPDFHVFARHNANEPDASKAAWVTRSLRDSVSDPEQIHPADVASMFRSDIFHQSVQPSYL
jgi:ABC-type nitrate/sulfonate/bicarbonate transport system substrate-binding protein